LTVRTSKLDPYADKPSRMLLQEPGRSRKSWRRYLREFGGLAKVDRIGGYAAKFSRSISIP